jgi:MFS transporter, ACS family, pantothenate transporter
MGHAENNAYPYSPDAEDNHNESQERLVVKPIKSWKGYVWDTWELPKDQRWLLFKLDAFVLTFASVSEDFVAVWLKRQFSNQYTQIGYFLKNLDLNNVNNAFLSGMEEDLQMFGNQLVTSTSIYTVGYVIGQIPSNLLLTRVSPRWVIPSVRIFPVQSFPQLMNS